MTVDNSMRSTKNNKKSDGKFHSKHIKHDPQAESARAQFGMKNPQLNNAVNNADREIDKY